MENNIRSKVSSVLNYIKTVIFFRVPKEEKDYVRKETMKADHKILNRMLVLITLCQIVMILVNIFRNYKDGFSMEAKHYIISYLFLLTGCAIIYVLLQYFLKKGNSTAYIVITPIAVNVVFIWGCVISLIDSVKYSIEITTFSYVSLAITAFILLEPWVYILDSIGYSTLLICLFRFYPVYSERYHTSVLISLISISLLTCAAATANFHKRLDSLKLKKENEILTESLKASASLDELTKVYNRRYLTEHIDDPINFGLEPSGVLMLDVDHFKLINDQYGHQNGDKVLAEIGKIISEYATKQKNSYTIRYGGDEFLIYLEHTTLNNIVTFAEDIRKGIEKHDFLLKDGTTIKARVSIGCSVATQMINYSYLINVADENLYEAKETGRNKVIFR